MSDHMGFYLPEYVPIMDKVVCNPTFSQGIFFFPDWASVSVTALLASTFLIAFLYLFASFFQNQQALARVKLEFYELAVTSVIFIVIFMLLNGMCSVKTGWLFPGAGTHDTNTNESISWEDKTVYYSSVNYLMTFADYSLWVMDRQYVFYMFADWLTSMEITSVPIGVGATMKPTAGVGAVVKPVLNNAFTGETIGVITAQAQAYIIDFGTYGLLRYFLPLGLVLRCFTVTRRIGGTLIALTLVFLFIYPFLIIPTYAIVNDSLFASRLHFFNSAEYANVFGWTSTSVKLLIELALKWTWGPDWLFGAALFAMPHIAKIFMGGVFMPLFNTIILVTTARYLSKALGEEIDITNLTRMI